MTSSPIFSVNFTNRKNPANLNCYMSIKKSQSSVWFTLMGSENETMFWHLELFSARLPVQVLKTLNDRQSYIHSTFRLTFLNRQMIVCFGWIISICEIHGEYRTAGHLVFWKPWPAVELKKVPSVTKHGFVFWAQHKPNATLEIYKAFQDRLTFLDRHMVVWFSCIFFGFVKFTEKTGLLVIKYFENLDRLPAI